MYVCRYVWWVSVDGATVNMQSKMNRITQTQALARTSPHVSHGCVPPRTPAAWRMRRGAASGSRLRALVGAAAAWARACFVCFVYGCMYVCCGDGLVLVCIGEHDDDICIYIYINNAPAQSVIVAASCCRGAGGSDGRPPLSRRCVVCGCMMSVSRPHFILFHRVIIHTCIHIQNRTGSGRPRIQQRQSGGGIRFQEFLGEESLLLLRGGVDISMCMPTTHDAPTTPPTNTPTYPRPRRYQHGRAHPQGFDCPGQTRVAAFEDGFVDGDVAAGEAEGPDVLCWGCGEEKVVVDRSLDTHSLS